MEALRHLVRVTKPGGVVAVLEADTLHHVILPWPIEVELAARAAELEPTPASNTVQRAGVVPRVRVVEVEGKRFTVRVLEPEQPWRELARRRAERTRAGGAGSGDAVVSPMQGTVLSVAVADGDPVEAGAVICIVEAMKMENEVRAHRGGVVADLGVAAGQPVGSGQMICRLAGDG